MVSIALSCGKNTNYIIACMDFFSIFKKKLKTREYIQQNLIYEIRLRVFFYFLFLPYLFSIIMCSKQRVFF